MSLLSYPHKLNVILVYSANYAVYTYAFINTLLHFHTQRSKTFRFSKTLNLCSSTEVEEPSSTYFLRVTLLRYQWLDCTESSAMIIHESRILNDSEKKRYYSDIRLAGLRKIMKNMG